MSEANTQRIESEHKLRVLRNEATLRREREKEIEARNMSDNMIKDQQISDMRGEIIALESRLKELDVAMAGRRTTSSGMVHHPMFEQLESELKIQQITKGDLVEEAHEYVKENTRMKDEVSPLSSKTALVSSGADLDKFKSELVAERKSHLVALNEKDIKIWSLQKDQDEKRLALNGKDGEISSLKARLQIMQYDSEMAVAHQPFSAGVMDVDCNEMLSELRSELEDEKAEHSVTKAY